MSIYNETSNQIREAITSILSQDFKDYELIIILDKPERSEIQALIESFNDPRIIFKENERNVGLAVSMNRAASLATADIFIRMDADDVCLPGRFNKEIEIIQSDSYDFVFSNYEVINHCSEVIRESKIEGDIIDCKLLRKKISVDPSIIHHPTVMFTKDIFYRAGGYRDFPCAQDSDLWLRMAEVGCRFYKLGQPYLRYRVNPNSITNNRWYQQQLTCHYILELSVQRLVTGNDSFSTEEYHKYLDRFNVDDEQAKNRLRNAVDLLSEAKDSLIKGHPIISLWLRFKVLLVSRIYRRHIFYLIIKKALLH